MYVVAIPIPDTVKEDVVEAFAAQYGYQDLVANPDDPTGPQIANPISKEQHLEDRIGFYLLDVTSANLVQVAEKQARDAAAVVAGEKAQATVDWFNMLRQARENVGDPVFGGNEPDPAGGGGTGDGSTGGATGQSVQMLTEGDAQGKGFAFTLPQDDPDYKAKAEQFLATVQAKAEEMAAAPATPETPAEAKADAPATEPTKEA